MISIAIILMLTVFGLQINRPANDNNDPMLASEEILGQLRSLSLQASSGQNHGSVGEPIIADTYWLRIVDPATYQTGYSTATDTVLTTGGWEGVIELSPVGCMISIPSNSNTVTTTDCDSVAGQPDQAQLQLYSPSQNQTVTVIIDTATGFFFNPDSPVNQ